MKIMFVCTGNTCRSPMAEYILKDLLKKNNIIGVKIKSCGLNAPIGSEISDNARAALSELGIKNCKHKACQFKNEYLNEYDLIITMTERHILKIPSSNKVVSLNKLTGCGDVIDPYMCPLPIYKEVSLQLINAFLILFKKGFFDKYRKENIK